MFEDLLNLTNSSVTVIRKVETPDGMGGVTVTSTITGIPKCAMWSPSQSARYISDKMAKASSHILVTLPSYYTFTVNDINVTYNSETYTITGWDNILNLGEILMIGLDKVL